MASLENLFTKEMDRLVAKVAKAHPLLVPLFRFLLRPFITMRLKIAARELATYEHLPPIQWRNINKHGNNIVYGSRPPFTDEKIISGIWVVDYTHKTRRIVFGLPPKLSKAGKSF